MGNDAIETVPAETGTGENTTPQEAGRTFSQEELDRIIKERLTKERKKSGEDIAAKEAELQQRELMLTAKAKFLEKGISDDMLSILKINSEEDINRAIDLLGKQPETRKDTAFIPSNRKPISSGDSSDLDKAFKGEINLCKSSMADAFEASYGRC